MNVTIYTLPTCPKCNMIKTKLTKKGITFSECQDLDVMRSMGIMSAPALQADDRLMRNLPEINDFVNGL